MNDDLYLDGRKHLEAPRTEGEPLCGAAPEGAFVVEQLSSATCPRCIALATLPG